MLVLITAITTKPGQFSTAADDLIALKSAGLSDRAMATMMTKAGAPKSAAASTTSITPLVIPDGTPVRLRLSRNLSSADSKTGDTVDFEVLEDVKLEDVMIIGRGGTAIGTITEAEHKKRMARGGKLNLVIDYARLTNGDKIALRAVKETKGGGHTGAMAGGMVAAAVVFFPAAPFFLFMHGKDTTIPKGTEITAYVNGEAKMDKAKLAPKL